MKALAVVFLSLSISSTVFASETVSGPEGDDLMSVLAQAGAFVDCGAGTCGTTVKDVVCREDKRVTGSQSCQLTVQTETGDQSALQTVTGQTANGLIDTLSKASMYDCKTEGCEGSAKSIVCTIPNNPDGASATCTIN